MSMKRKHAVPVSGTLAVLSFSALKFSEGHGFSRAVRVF